MLVEEVAAMYRRFTDETDFSFENNAEMIVNLRLAYEAFRRFIHGINPWALVNTAALVFANADFYQLSGAGAVIILGPGLAPFAFTGPKLVEIVALQEFEPLPGTQVIFDWMPVSSIDELRAGSRRFTLIDTQIALSEAFTGTLVLSYLGSGNATHNGATDWTQVVVGTNEVIDDDFDTFHDLIPMLAYDYYAIADGGSNPKLEEMKRRRLTELQQAVYRRMARSGNMVRGTYGKGTSGGWY